MHQGLVPRDWETAHIVPVFKISDPANPANYRPISLTSVCIKVMEHAVHSNFMKHLEQHNILTHQQHGFRKGRSCESQLILMTVNDIAKCTHDSSQIIDAILRDFTNTSFSRCKLEYSDFELKFEESDVTKGLKA